MDSVNEVDVLTANIDYVTAGRQLRSRQQQQPPAAAAPDVSAAGAERVAAASTPPTGLPSAENRQTSAGAVAPAPASPGATRQGTVVLPKSAQLPSCMLYCAARTKRDWAALEFGAIISLHGTHAAAGTAAILRLEY